MRHVELVAALPVARGILFVEHIDLGFGRQSEHGHQRRHRGRIAAADGLLVGRDQRTLVQRHALGAVEQLGGAHHACVLDAIERVAQHDMDKLVDEQRRRRAEIVPHQIGIGAFQRLVPQQMVAEADHHLPVLARIGDRRSPRCRRPPPACADRRAARACSVFSTAQASGGGTSSGRAR